MTEAESTLRVLLARRSIRYGFDGRAVPRDVLDRIATCGLAAPSSKNAQPWRLHVVTDRTLLVHLSKLVSTAKGVESYVPHDPRTGRPYPQYTSTVLDSAAVLLDVPAAIFIENLGVFSAGRQTLTDVPPEALAASLAGYGFEMIGIGAAVENMWIAANALGVAAAFMGDVVIAEDEIRAALGSTGDLAGVLTLGYSQAIPPAPMDTRALDDSPRVVWHR